MADDLSAPILSDAPPQLSLAPARPWFDRYLFERGIKAGRAARELGVSRQMVHVWRLAFDDTRRISPSRERRRLIEVWSQGAVPAWTFDDSPASRAAFFTPPPPVSPADPEGSTP